MQLISQNARRHNNYATLSFLTGKGAQQFEVIDSDVNVRLGQTVAIITIRLTALCELAKFEVIVEDTDVNRLHEGLRVWRDLHHAFGLSVPVETTDALHGMTAAIHVTRGATAPAFYRVAADLAA